jgi:4-hydroxyphenylpyruvate dioxygenase
MEIIAIDYIEFYVGNAKQATYFYENTFGFKRIAYQGPETGCKDMVSYVLRQQNISFVLTAPIVPNHALSSYLVEHGDGVKCVAFLVDDAKQAWNLALKNGAKSESKPSTIQDSNGTYIYSAVQVYGNVIHKFIERKNYQGVFAPGFVGIEPSYSANGEVGIIDIDHCTSNVESGQLEKWIAYYKDVLGFTEFLSFDETDIYTDYSALMTKVVVNPNQNIKLPLIQPVDREWKSQIQEFIDYNHGPGVQHIAVTTDNILKTVQLLSERGIEFLHISSDYYTEMRDRVGDSGDDFSAIQHANIMVDKENDGYIYQAFSKPLVDRPTFFIEIIQRKGAKAFGKGNVKEFFNALTLEQSKRGNI